MADSLDTIFKAYDIRGIYPDEIDESVARRIGNAFVAFTGAARVLVGRDARPSSEPLVAAFIEGATIAGADVVDLGLASTDLCYFAAGTLDAPAAMFTASHNPAQYNGIKLCRAGAAPDRRGDRPAPRSRRWSRGGPARAGRGPGPGRAARSAARVRRARALVRRRRGAARRCGSSPTPPTASVGSSCPRCSPGLPFELTMLFGELDGTFPNHPADPIHGREPEGPRRRAVLDSDADVGLAFDGDADRVVLVDDQGAAGVGLDDHGDPRRRRSCDRHPGEKVVHNLICSKAVPEVIREHGGEPIRSRVGHSFIKQVMAETGAVFGGEHSAHYYFRDNFRADSGLIAALMVLEQLSTRRRRRSPSCASPFERYAESGEINTRVDDPPP